MLHTQARTCAFCRSQHYCKTLRKEKDLGLALILIGIVFLLLGYPVVGIICVVVGIILLFVPGVPYGYSSWRGRRGPP
jgi:membrane-bound ClpP family serine protease